MKRSQLEATSPIQREQLLGLLGAMKPPEQQPITVRFRVPVIEVERWTHARTIVASCAATVFVGLCAMYLL
jgi:hypothetical protein